MKEKIVIIVQARMASSRLPGKVMLPIMGKSLLARLIERLQMIQHKAVIIIATSDNMEDDIIVAEAEAMNLPYYRGSINNLLDRHYQAAKLLKADVVVKIPSDCPLIDPRIVDYVLEGFFNNRGKYDYLSNLHPATWPDGNDVEVMTMACLKQAWENAGRPTEIEQATSYIWKNPLIFSLGNITMPTGLDFSMSHRFTLDYPEDYYFIDKVYKEHYPICNQFSCQDIFNLLNHRPDIYQLNTKYAEVNWYQNHHDELKAAVAY